MKSIICRAYNKKEKKVYWFDVLWGDEYGMMWMLPIEETEKKRIGGICSADNRIKVDPLGWEFSVELSPYMPAHLGLGNKDCCGIFDQVNDDGIAYCNECGMSINDAIQQLKEKKVE